MKKYVYFTCMILYVFLFTYCTSPGGEGKEIPPGTFIDSVPENYTVSNIKASCLEHTGMIRISWYDRLNIYSYENGSYVLYRYTDKNSEYEIKFRDIKTTCYEDKSAQPDSIYFYRVACVVNGKERPQSENYICGIVCSMGKDNFEPNNDYNPGLNIDDAKRLTDIEETSIIYYLSDGSGLYEEDLDWYYYDNPGSSDVRVHINLDTPDLIGKLELLFYGDSSGTGLNNSSNIIRTGSDFFYFLIRFNSVGYPDTIGSYMIRVESENNS